MQNSMIEEPIRWELAPEMDGDECPDCGRMDCGKCDLCQFNECRCVCDEMPAFDDAVVYDDGAAE